MKKKVFILVVCMLGTLHLVAQVTSNPSPIPANYRGDITLTFDPTKGTGGMASATACYSHIGLITSKSSGITDWKYIKPGGWGTVNEPAWTKKGNVWELTFTDMYTYFGCPVTESITAIVMVFHDGKGSSSKEGKSTSTANGDILVYIGKVVHDDIWEGFEPAACVEQARPAGVSNGIYYGADGTSVTLCTYAASKTEHAQHVFLIGDMTDWALSNDYQLKRDGNYFWIHLDGLTAGQEYRYQYAIIRSDNVKKQISDLYSEKVLSMDDAYEPKTVNPDLIAYPMSGASGYVSVIQPGKAPFQWSDATLHFQRPDKNNLIIYELWVYDHTPTRCLEGLIARLDYLQHLGVNCVELMPVNEFDGNQNWGYSPNHYFALDKAYGTPEQLKTFVDQCHQRGMAVILDMVFNHATGNNPMNKLYPYTSSSATTTELRLNPWFNVSAPHADNVYEDWNHGFEPVREHFTRVLQYWLTEYKIDGYRMDLSHGLCSDRANTSVENLKYYYNNGIKAVAPDAYFILEHWGSNMGSERPQLVAEGMMCWENTCTAFQQTAMGWLKDGDGLAGANKDGYVSYCENHDEERCFFKAKQWGNGTVATDEATRLARVPLNIGFQCMLNGPQLFYHFAELGFDYSKFQNDKGAWGKDGKDAYGTSVSSTFATSEYKMNPKFRPEGAGWFRAGARMQAYKKVAQTLQLRTRLLPSVFEGNPTAQNIGSGVSLRTVQWGSDVFVAGNFSATASQTLNLPTGTWYDYFNGGSKASSSYTLAPGEFRIFTGRAIVAPTDIPDAYDFPSDLEELSFDSQSAFGTRPSTLNSRLFLHRGRLGIIRDGVRYNLLGGRE